VLARGAQSSDYRFSSHAPFLMAVAQDPVLACRLMVAEPWDIGPGGYQLGHFPTGWLEWNDKFRDTQRAFWLCQQESLGAAAQRLAGSADCFGARQRGAHSSVNFITAHDGFTLSDVVSFNERHNRANGEDNRDGHGHNLSFDHGAEGPTDDPTILAWRLRDKRALLAANVFSLGTPMLLAGDDIGHSQRGNNNAYCQDNATTWLNWAEADLGLSAYVARLLRVRRARRALQARAWWRGAGDTGDAGAVQVCWSTPGGHPLSGADWDEGRLRALALHLQLAEPQAGAAGATGADCLLLLNAARQPQTFALPSGPWFRHIDSSDADAPERPLARTETLPAGSLWLASTYPLFTP
jgi:glycogen operon protein